LDTLSYEKWLVVLLSINRNNQVTKLSKRKNILHNVSSVPLQSACEVVLVLPCQWNGHTDSSHTNRSRSAVNMNEISARDINVFGTPTVIEM